MWWRAGSPRLRKGYRPPHLHSAMIQILAVSSLLLAVNAFMPSRIMTQNVVRMAENESPLPSLDTFLKQPVTTQRGESESPLVDRVCLQIIK